MHLQHGIYNPTRNGSPMVLLECLLVVPTLYILSYAFKDRNQPHWNTEGNCLRKL